MQFLAPDEETAWGTVLAGEPHSKARPRFNKEGRAYKDPADAEAERATKDRMRLWWRRPPLTGNVALGCVFHRSSRQEIDGDNLLKHVCDAGNGLLWVDDSQVTAKYAEIQLDPERPRTVLVIAPHVSTMRRGTDNVRPCEGCGGSFTPSRAEQRFCKRECFQDSRRTKAVTR